MGTSSIILFSAIILTNCDGGRVIDTEVIAAAGGTFSDNPCQPTLSITIAPGSILADTPLAHARIDEIVSFSGSNWDGLSDNFNRPSKQTVVALPRLSQATFRVVHRARRLAVGMGAPESLDVFLNETSGKQNFFGPVIGPPAMATSTMAPYLLN